MESVVLLMEEQNLEFEFEWCCCKISSTATAASSHRVCLAAVALPLGGDKEEWGARRRLGERRRSGPRTAAVSFSVVGRIGREENEWDTGPTGES
jgi:hypothetical protein